MVAPPIGRYRHSVTIPPNATLLLISGQVGINPEGELGATYEEQWRHALQNVVLNVEAGGMNLKDIVKCTALLVERYGPTRDEDRARITAISKEILGDHVPTWTTPTSIPDLVRPGDILNVRGRRCRGDLICESHPRPSPAYRLPPRALRGIWKNSVASLADLARLTKSLSCQRWHEGMQRWPDRPS